MNILSICNYEFYEYPEASFVHQQAVEFVKEGCTVHVLVLFPFGKRTNEKSFIGKEVVLDGVNVHLIRYISLSNYGTRFFNDNSIIHVLNHFIKYKLRNFSPDVIHVHAIGNAKPGVFLKDHYKARLVVTVHGSDFNIPFSKSNYSYIQNKLSGVDKVITVSSVLGRNVKKVCPNIEVCTILNGFVKSNLCGGGERSKDWIQVGHLIPSKHHETTIEAFAKYHKTHSEAKLLIIGEGYLKDELRKMVSDMELVDSVIFYGQIPNKEVLRLMNQSKYFVMVSSPEGLGIVYLEAMASGCIVIGTKGEGIEDVIVDGENGFLVEVNDVERINRVIDLCENDTALCSQIRRNAQLRLKELTWKENARNCLSFMHK